MKKLVVALLLLGMLITGLTAEEKQLTKVEQFLSRTGKIVRVNDYSLGRIYSSTEVSARKIESEGEVLYACVIEKSGEYGNATAFIEESDLDEIIAALKILKQQSVEDEGKTHYIENKFITDDGFRIGYYTTKGKIQWFMKLERYASRSTIWPDLDKIESYLSQAKQKITEIKS